MPPNKRFSRSTVGSSENHPSIPKISDRLEELHLLAQQLSMTTSEVERWIKAINNLSSMVKDRKNLDDLIFVPVQLGSQKRQTGGQPSDEEITAEIPASLSGIGRRQPV